jgi:hypothetical protein
MAQKTQITRQRYWIGVARVVLVVGTVPFSLVWLTGCAGTSTPFPGPVGENCGTVQSTGSTALNPTQASQAEQCLWYAYQTCKTASLAINVSLIDVGSNNLITVRPKNGSCAVTLTSQGWNANGHVSDIPVQTYTCASLQPGDGGIVAKGCGSAGDLNVPAWPPQRVGTLCGEIGPGTQRTANLAAIDCFWLALSTCPTPATLIYTASLAQNAALIHTLVIQAINHMCVFNDAVQRGAPVAAPYTVYRCAQAKRTAGGGIVALRCGAEGNVTVLVATSPNES